MENDIDLPDMQVFMTTTEQYVEGSIDLPQTIKMDSSEPDDMLFYILNGGFQFITLKNCEVKDRKNLAFRPDRINRLHVNISTIVSIQLVSVDGVEVEQRLIQKRTGR